jgi:hypothetical protein
MTAVGRVSEALTAIAQAAARRASRHPGGAPEARSAWAAWRAGDFAVARGRATDLLAAGQAVNEARHVLTLVAAVDGAFEEAIATHGSIDARYRRLAELDEPIVWAHLHREDVAGALAFAERRGLGRRGTDVPRLRAALEHPLEIEIEGVAEIPFTDDPLTPLMPGFPAVLNGRSAVARLDTGGAFVHLTAEAAVAFGVRADFAVREFAALGWHTIRSGVADLELGPVLLRNVPVAVHDGALPARAIADAFGVELGPIIGTNILERFLATIDAPGQRLILSRRGERGARDAHLARLAPTLREAPFALWGDHLMIARGRAGNLADANLFVDSGLVAFTPDQGQAALLVGRGALASLGAAEPAPGTFANVPGEVAIGPAARHGLTAYPVPDSTWRNLGNWGGIRVDALVSWGFLRHFSWTIDFDRRRYLFGQEQSLSA